MNRLKTLRTLLMEQLPPAELRDFLVGGPNGDVVEQALPRGSGMSPKVVVTEGLRVLENHGMLDAGFFAHVRERLPQSQDAVNRVEALWNAEPGPRMDPKMRRNLLMIMAFAVFASALMAGYLVARFVETGRSAEPQEPAGQLPLP